MTRRTGVIVALSAIVVLRILLVAVAAEKKGKGKGYLGVYLGELTSDVAADYGVQPGQGVLVEGVSPESPADEAGLRENDVIIRMNSIVPTGPEEFRTQIGKMSPGDNVTLTYLRGGKEKTADVKLIERDTEEFGFQMPKMKRFHVEGPPWEWTTKESGDKIAYAGIVTQSLSEGLASYFKVEKGTLISEVVKDSPAERAGLLAGDIILRIGDKVVAEERDVRRAIRDHKPGEILNFVISRNGAEMTVAVTLGEQFGSFEPDIHIMGLENMGDLRALIPDEKDLDRMRQELDQMKIEIESLPDLNSQHLRVKINHGTPVKAKEDKDGSDSGTQRLRDRFTQGFQKLSHEIDRLSAKLKAAQSQYDRTYS